MPAYVAMLRGINVSGHKIIRMEQLRDTCTALGFRNLQTYVQSGNLVFLADSKSPSAISKNIAQAILDDFGFSVPVLVKTLREMKEVIENNPFLKEEGIDLSKLHVTFLSKAAPKNALNKLTSPTHAARSVSSWPARNLSLLSGRVWHHQAQQYGPGKGAGRGRHHSELENR